MKIVRQMYYMYAFVYSRLQYGIEIYECCSQSNISEIQSLQNKLLKLILQLDRWTGTNELHLLLNIAGAGLHGWRPGIGSIYLMISS